MGVSVTYAGVYRARLVEDGIIEPAGRGLVCFTIPYLADYLRETAQSDALKRIMQEFT